MCYSSSYLSNSERTCDIKSMRNTPPVPPYTHHQPIATTSSTSTSGMHHEDVEETSIYLHGQNYESMIRMTSQILGEMGDSLDKKYKEQNGSRRSGDTLVRQNDKNTKSRGLDSNSENTILTTLCTHALVVVLQLLF